MLYLPCLDTTNLLLVPKVPKDKKLLIDFVGKIRSYKPNGKDFPRIILFSPIAFEDLKDRNLPRGRAHNRNLAAMQRQLQMQQKKQVVMWTCLVLPEIISGKQDPLTLNGVQLNELGNRKVGEVIAKTLLGNEVASFSKLESLRQSVLEKNLQWINRYRATDGNDIWGGRSGLRFVNDQSNAEVLQHELVMRDVLTANRDKLIWATAQGKKNKVNDKNVPAPNKVISNVGERQNVKCH